MFIIGPLILFLIGIYCTIKLLRIAAIPESTTTWLEVIFLIGLACTGIGAVVSIGYIAFCASPGRIRADMQSFIDMMRPEFFARRLDAQLVGQIGEATLVTTTVRDDMDWIAKHYAPLPPEGRVALVADLWSHVKHPIREGMRYSAWRREVDLDYRHALRKAYAAKTGMLT